MPLFITLQHLLPQHLLTRCVGHLAASEQPLIKSLFIRQFARRYQIDMSEAAEPNLAAYPSFNAFFTRALKPGARPIDTAPDALVCPADGAISQLGTLDDDRLLQAKGHQYTVSELLADPSASDTFRGGSFCTVYLSPRDYHRVHLPLAGTLRETRYVPGDLFSVNTVTADHVPNLFARNERLVCLFDTAHGPMALVLVGAMIVAGIETVWGGREAATATVRTSRVANVHLKTGDEVGRFLLGSTAIVVLPAGLATWEPQLEAGSPVRMGTRLGTLHQRA